MTIFALRGWRSGLAGRVERGREALRERLRLRLRLSRWPLAAAAAGPLLLLRERVCEASRGVTERACDLDRASSSSAAGVGERPRDGLRLSDMVMVVVVVVGGGGMVALSRMSTVCAGFICEDISKKNAVWCCAMLAVCSPVCFSSNSNFTLEELRLV